MITLMNFEYNGRENNEVRDDAERKKTNILMKTLDMIVNNDDQVVYFRDRD